MDRRYNSYKKEETNSRRRIKFDVMLHGRFVKTLYMEAEGSYVSEEQIRKYAESKLPLTLRGEDYEVYVDEFC